jgi:hypothetical protein
LAATRTESSGLRLLAMPLEVVTLLRPNPPPSPSPRWTLISTLQVCACACACCFCYLSCLSVCLSIYLFVCLSVCLYVDDNAEMASDMYMWYVAGHFSGFTGAWPGYTGPSRNRAPAAGSPSFGVEGVDELIGFTNPSKPQVTTFLSKLTD